MTNKLKDLVSVLGVLYPGRIEQAEAIVAGLISGLPVFLMSPPGTAKTAMVETLSRYLLQDVSYFYYLLTRFTEPDELLGPLDINALRRGEYRRITSNKLPNADIAFLDEIFKASSAIRNTLLDIILNRRIVSDGKVIEIPLIALYTASNEVSDDEEDMAMYDRLVIRSFFGNSNELGYVIEKGILITAKGIASVVKKPVMNKDEVLEIQRRVREKSIEIARNGVKSKLVEAITALRSEGIDVSDRRAVQTVMVIAALSEIRGEMNPAIIADALMMTTPRVKDDIQVVEDVIEKMGFYASRETIEKLMSLIGEAKKLEEEYRNTGKIQILAALASIVKEVNSMALKTPYLPRSMVEEIQRIIVTYNEFVEEIKKLGGQ